MQSLWNAVLYNGIWFVAVWCAAAGDVWTGPMAMACFVLLHLRWTPPRQRAREAGFLFVMGLLGATLDTVLSRIGFMGYPTSQGAWAWPFVPPWIACLWVGFATMPRFSLAWLGRFHWSVAAAFGAVGGGLAFYSGSHLGAIAPGFGGWTYAALAFEYALLTPLMVFGHAALFRPAADSLEGSNHPITDQA
ncbi:MAG: DUF2878 domain-containing protein [Planctomycetota bacterium]|nr:DUF2878 domain-containing protein [Planctomycetota bacterium]